MDDDRWELPRLNESEKVDELTEEAVDSFLSARDLVERRWFAVDVSKKVL
jgi:hypothetical protein